MAESSEIVGFWLREDELPASVANQKTESADKVATCLGAGTRASEFSDGLIEALRGHESSILPAVGPPGKVSR